MVRGTCFGTGRLDGIGFCAVVNADIVHEQGASKITATDEASSEVSQLCLSCLSAPMEKKVLGTSVAEIVCWVPQPDLWLAL